MKKVCMLMTCCCCVIAAQARPTLGWGSTDERYASTDVPSLSTRPLVLHAWRGERVMAQAVLRSADALSDVSFTLSDLRDAHGHVVSGAQCSRYFVREVLTDAYSAAGGVYEWREQHTSDSVLMADRLEPAGHSAVGSHSTVALWLDIKVPSTVAAGRYVGQLRVTADSSLLTLPLSIEVSHRTLPVPALWAFHLDLWQNPYAVARYYGDRLWSKEHFDHMRPLMLMLAAAGQKVITCTMVRHPWNSQTEDPFEDMIGKTLTIDGEWRYDYTVLDRWVEFMISTGISQQIDFYTVVPWQYTFNYYAAASNTVEYIHARPGERAYEAYLLPLLRDLAAHLKAKGWFDRTMIAMDERPMDALRAAYDLVQTADSGYRIEGAAKYFPAVERMISDMSLYYEDAPLPDTVLAARKACGKTTTVYTCCGPAHPNTFCFSQPAEAAYLPLHAVAMGYDGYLRWAYNSWPRGVPVDGRFRTWPAGDCMLVYPDGPSIRFERLVAGIQDCEKIRILRRSLKGEALRRLNAVLAPFRSNGRDFSAYGVAAGMVRTMEEYIASLD